jgi:hypothetical protein
MNGRGARCQIPGARCQAPGASVLPTDCEMAGKRSGLLRMRNCEKSALKEPGAAHDQNAPVWSLRHFGCRRSTGNQKPDTGHRNPVRNRYDDENLEVFGRGRSRRRNVRILESIAQHLSKVADLSARAQLGQVSTKASPLTTPQRGSIPARQRGAHRSSRQPSAATDSARHSLRHRQILPEMSMTASAAGLHRRSVHAAAAWQSIGSRSATPVAWPGGPPDAVLAAVAAAAVPSS